MKAEKDSVSDADKKRYMFWKEVLKKANKCIKNGRDPEVSNPNR